MSALEKVQNEPSEQDKTTLLFQELILQNGHASELIMVMWETIRSMPLSTMMDIRLKQSKSKRELKKSVMDYSGRQMKINAMYEELQNQVKDEE